MGHVLSTQVQVRNAIGEKNLSRAALQIVYDTKIQHFSETESFASKYHVCFCLKLMVG